MTILQKTARNLATLCLLTLWAVASAHGQATPVLSANVPFSFEAVNAQLPAGTYQFESHPSEKSLLIRPKTGAGVTVPIIAVLAGASLYKDVGLVFDNVGRRHVLSEVWIPGEGGVLVNASQGKPTREMVVAVVSGAAPNMSGKEVFDRTCARCHGPQGKGNPDASKFFQTPVPKLDSAYVQTKSDQELKDIISHGRRQMDPVRMRQAAVQHLLDPDSVDAVVRYLRTLK